MNLLLESEQSAEQGNGKRPIDRFRRLFELLGLPESELESLQRNLVSAQAAARSTDAQDRADAPLMPQRFEQLAWLGMTPATLQALRPYVTLLPLVNGAPTKVNVNTAAAQVIYAAVPGLDLAGAERIVSERDKSYFKSEAAALSTVQRSDATPLTSDWVSVTTNFFEIRGRLRLDDLALEEISVVQRVNAAPRRLVLTLWRQRVALTTPKP